MFGVIGAIITKGSDAFCVPLRMSIQEGLRAAASWEGSNIPAESHVQQMVRNGFQVADRIGSCILVYGDAIHFLQDADLLIIGGTSREVWSAARLVHIYHDGHMVIINMCGSKHGMRHVSETQGNGESGNIRVKKETESFGNDRCTPC